MGKRTKSKKRVAVPIAIPKRGRKGMASWTKKSAEVIKRSLEPLVGKEVVLFGGGGLDINLGTLKDVTVAPDVLYGRIVKGKRQDYKKPRESKTSFHVSAHLFSKEGGLVPFGAKEFSPHIGSWRIAEIKNAPPQRL